MLDDIFLGVSGHRRGDGLEFYHALVLLLHVLVVTEGRPGKSLEFYYALVLFLVLLVVTEVRHGKILDTRLPLQRSVHTGTWECVPSPLRWPDTPNKISSSALILYKGSVVALESL